MTPFAALCALAGLSHREAAGCLGCRIDTVKSWSSGRVAAPDGPLDELRSLIRRQERAAAELLAAIENAGAGVEIELGYPADDAEARELGWPGVGAWRAMAARVIAAPPGAADSRPIRLVPRGSTPATAAAADAHERQRKFAPRPGRQP